MKKLASIVAMFFVLTILPLGLLADDNVDQPTIPNHTIAQDNTDAIPNLADDTEDEDLTPAEISIIKRDAIRSNASTNVGSDTGQ